MRPDRSGGLVAAVLLLLALVAAGCGTVQEPDPEDWDESARVSLGDASSQLATVRVVLETARRDDTWHGYAVVMVADAEQSAGKDVDAVSQLQAPPERSKVASKVTDLLSRASDLVQQARELVVANREIDPKLLERLQSLGDKLDAQEKALR